MKNDNQFFRGLHAALKWADWAFSPPTPVLVLGFVASIALVIWVLATGQDDYSLIAIASYALSGYFSVAVCVAIVKINLPGRGLQLLRAVPFAPRLMDDEVFRSRVSAAFALALNTAWAVGNLAVGIYSASVWFITLGVYYAFLTIMRAMVVVEIGRIDVSVNPRGVARVLRISGILLIVSVVVLSGVVTLVMVRQGSFNYPGYFVYAYAAYTFYSLAISIVNCVRWRRHENPLMTMNTRINLSIALVTLFAMEIAMLAAFSGSEDTQLQFVAPVLTGAGVAAALCWLGVSSLLQAKRIMREAKQVE